jgi:hypothetical protein
MSADEEDIRENYQETKRVNKFTRSKLVSVGQPPKSE